MTQHLATWMGCRVGHGRPKPVGMTAVYADPDLGREVGYAERQAGLTRALIYVLGE
jgi:hypothetical protein